ncbi:dihydropteroate synthase [Flavobacterium saliperosum S13]|uniref:Dihydropteroate synthase n=2 Tax=Flavobacterium saliperosum TaxID=329186 RepID=A0A1G4W1R7_9FLAO|nr:dihydropteroate synthase [Flavobacterium saliperosum]ESU27575.1 dihydropteroate synthase [Flavobacterium saliperosum S13]SCX15341.1 dihydropteroate synthase [Flavobacterium saliperosum]
MTINCKGELVDLSSPKVMGILNITPDSFFDGGKYKSDADFLNQTEKMLSEGASFIDVGAYSSRPNAVFVSEEDEIKRLIPILDVILNRFPKAVLSIDTFRAAVAKAAIESGAAIINDISAGVLDDKMLEVIADANVPYIMMHMRGTPQTMTTLTEYDDIVKEMIQYFSERVAAARTLGINDIIIDPGFGFAKTTNQNYEVMQKMELFQMLDLPLLSAISRKSMIYKVLDTNAQEALNGTTFLNTISLMKGAKILRVHDVKEAMECVTLFKKITKP